MGSVFVHQLPYDSRNGLVVVVELGSRDLPTGGNVVIPKQKLVKSPHDFISDVVGSLPQGAILQSDGKPVYNIVSLVIDQKYQSELGKAIAQANTSKSPS